MRTSQKVIELLGMGSGSKSSRGKGGGGSGPGLFRGKYKPESFIVPGSDQNGNSVRLWCRVVPLLDRAIDVIFSSRKFPFRAKGDLMRWCLKVGVDHLNEMEPIEGSVLAQVDAMMEILVAEQHNFAFLTLFQTATTTIGAYVQAQAMGEARRLLTMLQVKIGKMDEGYWKDRYTREIGEKFGYLIGKGTMVEGAGLGEHVDSGRDAAGEDSDGDGDGGIDEDEDS